MYLKFVRLFDSEFLTAIMLAEFYVGNLKA